MTVDVKSLVTDNLDLWSSTLKKKNTTGRGSSKKNELYGIKKLRELILELAVRGLLVPQDPNDEPASVLLDKIAAEKKLLLKRGKIKKQKPLPPIGENEKAFELPEGWGWCRTDDFCMGITSGTTPPKSEFSESDGVPYLKVYNIRDQQIDFEYKPQYINSEFHKSKLTRSILYPGDVVMNIVGPPLGKTAIIPTSHPEWNCNQAIVYFRCIEKSINEFLYTYIKAGLFLRFIELIGTAGQDNISVTKSRTMLVPMPPLPEQHRIVTKVNELMALCDQLEQQQENSISTHQVLVETLLNALTQVDNGQDTNAATTNPANTKQNRFQQAWALIADNFDHLFTTEHSIQQLKQTILQLAVMGKLVPQDPNDEPASVLLKKIAAEKALLIKDKKIKKQKPLPPIGGEEKPFALPDGWEWCRVWDVAELITSGSRDWAKYYSDSGPIFVTMGNLSRGSYVLRMDNIRYVKPPAEGEGKRTRLEQNDLLISITGDVGNLGLIPEGFGEAYINQHTAMLRFMPDCQDRYFPEFMRSPVAKFQFDAPQRGIKNSFRLGDVGEMLLSLPPKPERIRIVAKVNELMTLCDNMLERIKAAQTTQLNLTDAIAEQALTK